MTFRITNLGRLSASTSVCLVFCFTMVSDILLSSYPWNTICSLQPLPLKVKLVFLRDLLILKQKLNQVILLCRDLFLISCRYTCFKNPFSVPKNKFNYFSKNISTTSLSSIDYYLKKCYINLKLVVELTFFFWRGGVKKKNN